MEGDVVRCEGRREQNEEQGCAACGRIPTRSLQQQARQEGKERHTADGSRQEQRKDGVTGKEYPEGDYHEKECRRGQPQAGSPPGFGANRPSESTVSAYLVNMNESSMREDVVNLVQIDRTRIAAKAGERSGAAAWNERRIPVSAMTDPFGTAAGDN